MRELPEGTVTFLFTDIEGSTRLLARMGADYTAVLNDYRLIIRSAVKAAGGYEVDTAGDGFFVVFRSALQAVRAAIAAQLAIAGHPFPDGAELKVRMGLHTGEGTVSADTYVGLDVHRAARIGAAGHGGQTVISSTTARLIRDDLEDVVVMDLGLHRLKDLPHPEHLFSITAPGLPSEFPPLRSLDVSRTNLPRQLTSFVGRTSEKAEIGKMLESQRMLTLVGAGGTGKTRLAIEIGREILLRYPDGVWLVPLAPVMVGSGVVQACLSALGAQEQPGRSLMASLIDFLQPKTALLILDNCEQVVAACASMVTQLFNGCENLSILATTRQPLGVSGETLFALQPLTVPGGEEQVEDAEHNDAVQLFVDRAQAVRPTFQLTDDVAGDVVALVRKLEGMPLALELAAARLRSLSAGEILARLGARFDLLASRGSVTDERHRTINAAIDWSHNLLEEDQRAAFRRLSVFAGGWDLDASESVVVGHLVEQAFVVDLVTSLVDQSLVLAEEREGRFRYRMLEPIRFYALGKLVEADEEAEYRERHARWLLASLGPYTAYFGPPDHVGLDKIAWYKRLQVDNDNARAAHDWFTRTGDSVAALELVAGLGWFWFLEGLWAEGRARSMTSFAMADGHVSNELRPLAAVTAAYCAFRQGDYREVEHLASVAHDMAGAVNNPDLLITTLCAMTLASMVKGDLGESKRLGEQGLENADRTEVTWLKGMAQLVMGRWGLYAGDMEVCMAGHAEAYRSATAVNEPWVTVSGLLGMGAAQFIIGDLPAARNSLGQALDLSEAAGVQDETFLAMALMGLVMYLGGDIDKGMSFVLRGADNILRRREWTGRAVLAGLIVPTLDRVGEVEAALNIAQKALTVAKELDDKRGILRILVAVIRLGAAAGELTQALRLAEELITRNRLSGDLRTSIATLLTSAEVLVRFGELLAAARLWGAAQGSLERSGMKPRFIEKDLLQSLQALLPATAEIESEFLKGHETESSEALQEAQTLLAALG